MEIKYIQLPKKSDERGSLSVMEADKNIPFAIQRVYYMYDLPNAGAKRGEHAHRETQQVLFCIHGKVKVGFDDGKEKQLIELSEPNVGIIIPPMIWHRMEGFEDNCILLVIASDVYKEDDYIREYEKFLDIVKQK